MKTTLHLFLPAVVFVGCFPLGAARAQEYFRELDTRTNVPVYQDPSVYNEQPMEPVPAVDLGYPQPTARPTVETTPRYESTAQFDPVLPPTSEEEEKYNWALGQFRFNVAAGVGLEYNDNINLAPKGQEDSDLILRPSLILASAWRLSEMNTLRFSIGVSYAKYFSHSEYDTFLLSPDSQLAISFLVGNVMITLRDRFSYQEDPYDLAVLDNVSTYRRFENQAGIQMDWAINPDVDLTVGYDHYNLWAFTDEFDSLTRSVDTVYVRPAVQITPSVKLGLNGSVSWVNFKEDIQNNGQSYFLGAFVEAAVTDSTSVYLEAGWQQFNFDNSGTIDDSSDSSSPYVRAEIVNQLTASFTQRLSFSRTAEIGYNTNYFELNAVEYSANWEITPSLIGTPTLFYEYYTTSGEGAEKASRYGVSLGLRYILTPSVTLGLDYRFLLQDSNLPDSDYAQNLVYMSLFYNF